MIYVTIYDLLLELEKAGVGCFWKHYFVGAAFSANKGLLAIASIYMDAGVGDHRIGPGTSNSLHNYNQTKCL